MGIFLKKQTIYLSPCKNYSKKMKKLHYETLQIEDFIQKKQKWFVKSQKNKNLI